MLQKHIPRVSRSIRKVIKNLDNPELVTDYLQVLGKIHHQNGIQVRIFTFQRSNSTMWQSIDWNAEFCIFSKKKKLTRFLGMPKKKLYLYKIDRRTKKLETIPFDWLGMGRKSLFSRLADIVETSA